ncbi:MAG: putative bifunctional diguanylate cyclase/phosphodiesterase [Armatimonadota bacterium]
MQQVLAEILQIDILTPPKDYIAKVLHAICEKQGYLFANAIEFSSTGAATVFTSHNFPEDPQGWITRHMAQSLVNLTKAQQIPDGVVVIHNPSTSLSVKGWDTFCLRYDIRTIVTVPLCNSGHVLGSYCLFASQERDLSMAELKLLEQVGEMASVAIASNRYLEQLNQRSKELQAEVVERKRAEMALRQALRERKELEEIVNRSPVVVFLWRAEADWPVEFVSRSIEQYGYTPEDLYSGVATFTSIIHPADLERVNREVEQYLDEQQNEFVLLFRITTKQGDLRWVETHIWVRRDSDGRDLLPLITGARGVVTHLQGIMQDVTERKQAEETIRHQAFHDTLTDLPNRVLFHDRLTVALKHAHRNKKKLAVMFLDLDRFKTINDTLGHAVGDQLLQGVAGRLRRLLREDDTVSRLGGDEFTLLLPEITHADDAANVARKILETFRPAFEIDGRELYVTTSIGISLYPNDGLDAQALLQNADTALYHAKEQGRNLYQFYTPSMNARTLERLSLENNLRYALEREQFVVHYQPQVALESGQVIGMESLVRWQHPEMGLVSPAQFIPLAEETGLIEPIGEWVLHEACSQSMRWQHDGFPPLKVAVNLSARQFHQSNLCEMVAKVLQDTGLQPHLLELEITESVAMRNVEYSVMVMRNLKGMGIQLSMDDFGVGYSSLIYLKKFPINTLKIDQSFIRGLNSDPNDEAIATAIIAMAQSLHLQVIAEGVETEEQLTFLRTHQCNGMQGYFFSKPLPSDAFGQLLRFLFF